jgi:hypothetical protein
VALGWETPITGSVLVIDEAGMADIRTLEAVVTAVHAGGQVLLVGDHHQLPEVGAGADCTRRPPRTVVATLTVNRRQRHDWNKPRSPSCVPAMSPRLWPPTRHERVVVTDNPTAIARRRRRSVFAARPPG